MKMNDIIQMLCGAKKIIKECARVRSGEKVLIITDTEIDPSISLALAMATYYENADPVIITIVPRRGHGEEPPEPVREAMQVADVIITPTSKTLFHTKAIRDAAKRGARVLSMTGASPRTLKSGAITADFIKIKPIVDKLAEALTKAETLKLETPGGTKIEASIRGRVGNSEPGIAWEKGSMVGVPDIEVNIAPVEDSVEGIAVIDVTASSFGFVDTPIRIEIRNGKAVKIEGGRAADWLRKVLESANDPNQYYVAEIGFGLNPNAELRGTIIEDESALGTCHIAFGDNISLRGENKAPFHIDLVMKDPILELDGIKVIDKDKVLLENVDELLKRS